MADSVAPLDDALKSVQRELGDPPAGDTTTGDPFAPPVEPVAPQPKKKGRPINPNGRRARRGLYSGVTPASGKVSDPPVPEVPAVELAKIPPESVAQSIKQLDAIVVKLFGTTPLTPEEASGGGGVFAPVLDHYMPLMTEKGGLWLAPLTWVVLAYGPRAYELLDKKQQADAARKRETAKGAQSGDERTNGFPLRVVDPDPAKAFAAATA